MGLDWIPISPKRKEIPNGIYNATKKMYDKADKKTNKLWEKLKAKLGEENEKLVSEFYHAISDEGKYKRLLQNMTVEKADVLEIPKVGLNKEATDFMKKHIKNQKKEIKQKRKKGEIHNKSWAKYWSRGENMILADEWLSPISDLVEGKEWKGAVSGFMLVGPDSFRGKCLGWCDFCNINTHEDMNPKKMLDNAQQLENSGKNYAKENSLEWENIGNSKKNFTGEGKDKEYSIWIGYQAIKWLRFWANKGFSLNAWY